MSDHTDHDNIQDALDARRYSLADVRDVATAVYEAMDPDTIQAFDLIDIATAAQELPPLLKYKNTIFHDPDDKARIIIHASVIWNFQQTRKNYPRNTLAAVMQPLDHYPELAVSRPEDLLRWKPRRRPSQKKKNGASPTALREALDHFQSEIDDSKAELRKLRLNPAVLRHKCQQKKYDDARREKVNIMNKIRRLEKKS